MEYGDNKKMSWMIKRINVFKNTKYLKTTIFCAFLIMSMVVFGSLGTDKSNAAAAPKTVSNETELTGKSFAGSTSISEIVEIKNNTKDTYFMYVWDNEHEGRYTPLRRENWYYPDEGKWLEIKPGAHLRADDCGIPDGGKTAGKDRVRIIFKAKPKQRTSKGDPSWGLRVNRVDNGNDTNSVVFRDHSTTKEIPGTRITFPSKMHQSLILRFDETGVHFDQTDIAVSGEYQLQQGFELAGKIFEKSAQIFLEVMNPIKLPK